MHSVKNNNSYKQKYRSIYRNSIPYSCWSCWLARAQQNIDPIFDFECNRVSDVVWIYVYSYYEYNIDQRLAIIPNSMVWRLRNKFAREINGKNSEERCQRQLNKKRDATIGNGIGTVPWSALAPHHTAISYLYLFFRLKKLQADTCVLALWSSNTQKKCRAKKTPSRNGVLDRKKQFFLF